RTLFPHPPGYVSLGAAWDGRGHHVVGPNPSPYRAVVDRADAQWAMRPWRLSGVEPQRRAYGRAARRGSGGAVVASTGLLCQLGALYSTLVTDDPADRLQRGHDGAGRLASTRTPRPAGLAFALRGHAHGRGLSAPFSRGRALPCAACPWRLDSLLAAARPAAHPGAHDPRYSAHRRAGPGLGLAGLAARAARLPGELSQLGNSDRCRSRGRCRGHGRLL